MLRISKLADYGTVVMAHLAKRPGAVYSAREMAEESHIALPTVSKIFKVLEQNSLLVAHRGKNGGYRLAREPIDISVAQVIRAMEGPIAVIECGSGHIQCEHEDFCLIQGNWQRINQAILNALEAVSIAEMIEPISVQGVEKVENQALRCLGEL